MVVVYRNGVRCIDDISLVLCDEPSGKILQIQMMNEYVDIRDLPHIKAENVEFLYLQSGMFLYLGKKDFMQRISSIYVIEQTIENNQMKIANIDSVLGIDNYNYLLRYCDFNRIEEQNIVDDISEILSILPFIPKKEKDYMANKIEEFFKKKEVTEKKRRNTE